MFPLNQDTDWFVSSQRSSRGRIIAALQLVGTNLSTVFTEVGATLK